MTSRRVCRTSGQLQRMVSDLHRSRPPDNGAALAHELTRKSSRFFPRTSKSDRKLECNACRFLGFERQGSRGLHLASLERTCQYCLASSKVTQACTEKALSLRRSGLTIRLAAAALPHI